MKYIISMVLFFMVGGVNAEEILPSGCKPLMVEEESVTLPAGAPSLVMIHNLSNVDLWITHTGAKPDMNAGFSSRLQAGNWSALVLGKKTFELSCVESRPGHEQQVPCSDVLAVCQWLNATRPEKAAGTFWAGEDMSLSALTAFIGRHGFVLH